MISTPSESTTAAVAVILIDDSILSHSRTTSQEQENEELDDQLLAEMGAGSSQVVQVTEVTQVDLMSSI
jgi:hypothetical protein